MLCRLNHGQLEIELVVVELINVQAETVILVDIIANRGSNPFNNQLRELSGSEIPDFWSFRL